MFRLAASPLLPPPRSPNNRKPAPLHMQRVALFAHFDAQDEVKPDIERLLKGLREVCSRIVFGPHIEVQRARAGEAPTVRGASSSARTWGYDFAMWKDALDFFELGECDELVLSNSSVFGPILSARSHHGANVRRRLRFPGHDRQPRARLGTCRATSWCSSGGSSTPKRFGRSGRTCSLTRTRHAVILDYELGLTKHLTDLDFSVRLRSHRFLVEPLYAMANDAGAPLQPHALLSHGPPAHGVCPS